MESWWEMERMMFERRENFAEILHMYMHIFKQDSFVIIEIFHFFFSQHWLFINKCKHFDHIEQQHITFNSPPIFHQPLPESHINSSKFY